ncbi:MAG: 4-(cytidine 5'-diphospho)-2-C-methyl-D-erythritol kinase [Ignavibacteria bacterium]|jgi:4-diphosphocytidyl-2-C-methyl-D-erythritol kinase|nr:4-(cytidine 5'-diphospho)-2-C-methyl-D-erythritol kinase [Ignavibacteria bacterium]MCU7504032.1 4-(cytidine 5'-diphospho)-2-C-methyl-D-erythritol kinase [Ignavibacteria bacterium]MCU7515404.1 4-(cytidine 5'-diphospho)-2-C-methyl-D-erythritol kinase [Ignavibacteria bacterium]
MDYLEIKAPAKVNLGLFVTEKRADGYHNIETVFYPIYDLYDVLTFTRQECFEFVSNIKEIENESNLVFKAKLLLEEASGKKLDVKIELLKNIPMGAGMGGGSSDAAAALVSLNEMFGLKFNMDTLREFALRLGSDVPFFIRPRSAFAMSRGEALTMLNLEIPYSILIVNPGIHISTKEAYQNVRVAPAPFDLRLIETICWDNLPECIRLITNSFEEYAFNRHPEIENIKDLMYKKGAKFSLMTGSGSTVFGLFQTKEEAGAVRNALPKNYFTFLSL